ncbi:MAG: hypothetical protein KBT47_02435 [Armatimonadetes bacterium]|nr:hypothetical protein [Candidatus Hippobium faecium]
MTLYDELISLGEYYMAGFCSCPKKDRLYRTAKALETNYKYMKMPEHGDNAFYPDGNNRFYFNHQVCGYYYCFGFNAYHFNDRYENIYSKISEENREAFEELSKDMFFYHNGQCMNMEYSVGGLSYSHATIDFDRVLREGLDTYIERIKKNKKKNPAFFSALELTAKGIKIFVKRCAEYLASQPNPDKKLIKALKNVPMKPAKNFYEAMVCVNIMFYIDGCDCIGRFDQYMKPYLTDDVTDEEAIDLMKSLWQNVDDLSAWQVTIGGLDKNGCPGTNRVTELVLKSTKGFRRPQLTFFAREDETKNTWDLVFDCWKSGSGQPAIYNSILYMDRFGKQLSIKEEDLWRICFGGCTETHVFGASFVGSTSCGLQNLLIFERSMYFYLPKCKTYEEFYDCFIRATKRHILDAVRQCNLDQKLKAEYNPLPIRTLLTEDCIDTATEYCAGGARYNASSFNYSGTSNLINSLYTLKKLGFGQKYSNEEIMDACKKNFEGYEELLADIKKLPKFGQDCEEVDAIATDFFTQTTKLILKQKGWRRNCVYAPTFNLFTTYGDLGRGVGATPDGRAAYSPIGDSIGATQGDDTQGPTALINSVTKIPLQNMVCTPVFNIRIAKGALGTEKGRENIKALIDSYFMKNGMQMQATVADQAELIDALKHPENHESLIVRIGGYAEYFNRLPEDLKIEVIKRNQHF